MLRRSLTGMLMLVALAGCPGGNAGIGESCGGNDDCNGMLQCLNGRCVPRCQRAPECGDGFSCDDDGLCEPATGQAGDTCKSEVDCAAGLSCQIDGATLDGSNLLLASCTAEGTTRAAGAECEDDHDCRNGTCALGHCVDLCKNVRDCALGNSCMTIPHVASSGGLFRGCLPAQGAVTWPVPVPGPSAELLVPVPDAARSLELVMSLDDPSQKVGASSVLSPSGARIYTAPCSPAAPPATPSCTPIETLDRYFSHPVRHMPAPGQSVLTLPSAPTPDLELGAYRIQVSSFFANGAPGSAIPHVTAVVRLDTSDPTSTHSLDLHFFFLDLSDHPCAAMTDDAPLNARTAATARYFISTYLAGLRTVFFHASITINSTMTYEDIPNRPDLDHVDVDDVGTLLALGKYSTGINVFFVRSLSPVGVQGFSPNPGPAGLAGTRQSGIVIGLDTLCYRSWSAIARLSAHHMARFMGLYHNVELETPQHPSWRDPIDDGDNANTNNLMYFSELAGPDAAPSGGELTQGQGDILRRSAVLR